MSRKIHRKYKQTAPDMKVLAIDPGYGRIGFAILTKTEVETSLLFSECMETDKEEEFEKRLTRIGNRLQDIIQKHNPTCVAIERLFFSKNKKTALRTAEVRGVCMYTTKNHNIEITEYTPNQIKNAVTGNSMATKKDIIRMVPKLVQVDDKKRHDDEYDAIAIGITHITSTQSQIQNI